VPKILINTRTTGSSRKEIIMGRTHLVVPIVPIRGDTAMKGMFYANSEITPLISEFNNAPAPNGHPVIDGKHVSARDPVANNIYNVGGFIKNARIEGKSVLAEFWLDTNTANQSEPGIELQRRIQAKEYVGVSTAVTAAQIVNSEGVDDFGVPYTSAVQGLKVDHVAVLLGDEPAAGEHAGTKLIVNDFSVLQEELSAGVVERRLQGLLRAEVVNSDSYPWIQEVYQSSKQLIYEVNDTTYLRQYTNTEGVLALVAGTVQVERRVTYIPTKEKNMSKNIITALIANSFSSLGAADEQTLLGLTPTELVDKMVHSVAPTHTILPNSEAGKQLTEWKDNKAEFAEFQESRVEFTEFQKQKSAARKVLVNSITRGSDYTPDMLTGKSALELGILRKMLISAAPSAAPSAGGAAPTANTVQYVD